MKTKSVALNSIITEKNIGKIRGIKYQRRYTQDNSNTENNAVQYICCADIVYYEDQYWIVQKAHGNTKVMVYL